MAVYIQPDFNSKKAKEYLQSLQGNEADNLRKYVQHLNDYIDKVHKEKREYSDALYVVKHYLGIH